MEAGMTIIEAINGVNLLKPNKYTQEQMVEWLKNIDGLIHQQVIETHEGGEALKEYDSLNSKLLIPFPYEEIYINYLAMKIDFANGDIKKYNNSAAVYETSLREYKRWYHRNHMPK